MIWICVALLSTLLAIILEIVLSVLNKIIDQSRTWHQVNFPSVSADLDWLCTCSLGLADLQLALLHLACIFLWRPDVNSFAEWRARISPNAREPGRSLLKPIGQSYNQRIGPFLCSFWVDNIKLHGEGHRNKEVWRIWYTFFFLLISATRESWYASR